MKKFIVLSMLVAVAAITVGIIRRHEPAPVAVVAASVPTTTTTASLAPVNAPTTAKPAVKVPQTTARPAVATTATTVHPAVAPTTTTVAPMTTTTLAGPTPTCTVTAANPSVHGGFQTVTVSSNMPLTKTLITIQYPKFNTGAPNPRQGFTPTTDGAGGVVQSFGVIDKSTAPASVVVQFFNAAGHVSSGGCQTTFLAT